MLIARLATSHDVKLLAPNLRQEDKDEIDAASGETPEQALAIGLKSGRCWACDDGEPVAMFGVTPWPHELSTGYPWMLASDRLFTHKIRLLRESRAWVARLADGFDRLVTFSDARNTVHHEWLTWCGFERGRVTPYGVQRLPFIEFIKP